MEVGEERMEREVSKQVWREKKRNRKRKRCSIRHREREKWERTVNCLLDNCEYNESSYSS